MLCSLRSNLKIFMIQNTCFPPPNLPSLPRGHYDQKISKLHSCFPQEGAACSPTFNKQKHIMTSHGAKNKIKNCKLNSHFPQARL